MRALSLLSKFSHVLFLVLSFYSDGYSGDKTYNTKTDFICGDAEVVIVTKYHRFSQDGPPHCEEQKLTFKNIVTKNLVVTSSPGVPFDKSLDACIENYQCVKGRKQSFLVMLYRTGGNCDECEWQGILDLKGNRIAIDRYKNQKAIFTTKWKQLGLYGSPKLGGIEFNTVPD